MSEVHLLRVHPVENVPGQEAGLPPCPVCGAKAYLVYGLDFGWFVGCTRFYLNDGIHGKDMDTPLEEWLSGHGFTTKEEAVSWWRKRVERYGRANQ